MGLESVEKHLLEEVITKPREFLESSREHWEALCDAPEAMAIFVDGLKGHERTYPRYALHFYERSQPELGAALTQFAASMIDFREALEGLYSLVDRRVLDTGLTVSRGGATVDDPISNATDQVHLCASIAAKRLGTAHGLLLNLS